jgi:hypothetical protein
VNDYAAEPIDLATHEERLRATRSTLREKLDAERQAYSSRFTRPEISTQTGEHQRLQTRVPTRSDPTGTVVSMGRRADGRNHDGFGVTTIAHVDACARGGKAESRMTLQANGQLVVQSDMDSAYLLAAGPAVLASSAATNVLGAGGVVIAAGPTVPVAPVPIEGESPPAPKATSGHADAMQAQVDAWTDIDGALAETISKRDGWQCDLAPDQSSELRPAKDDADLAQLATKTFKDPNTLGTKVDGEGGALALSGAGGLLVSTPASGAMHAARWLGLSSAKVAVVGSELVDVTAAGLVSLTSGEDARLYAKGRLDVVSHTQPLHLASRTGDALEAQAKAIRIGATQPAAPQEATAAVSMRSTTHVGLATGDDAPAEDEAGVRLRSHDTVEAKAGTTVLLEAADSLTFKIADKTIQIAIDKGKKVTVTVEDTTIELSKSGGLSVKHGAEVLKGTRSNCFLGPSSSSRFEATSSGLTMKGGSIKIG